MPAVEWRCQECGRTADRVRLPSPACECGANGWVSVRPFLRGPVCDVPDPDAQFTAEEVGRAREVATAVGYGLGVVSGVAVTLGVVAARIVWG